VKVLITGVAGFAGSHLAELAVDTSGGSRKTPPMPPLGCGGTAAARKGARP
jgi:hypothetical protein